LNNLIDKLDKLSKTHNEMSVYEFIVFFELHELEYILEYFLKEELYEYCEIINDSIKMYDLKEKFIKNIRLVEVLKDYFNKKL
jgi:hypothetical protein